MKKTLLIVIAQLLLTASVAAALTEDQALTVLRQALPQAPEGWIVVDETRTDPSGSARVPGKGLCRLLYSLGYRRVAGMREERKRFDTAYTESSRRNREATRPQIDELIRQQTATSLALRKAVRRRDAAEEKRFNAELEANGVRMRSLHEETDRRIAQDMAPFLIRDAEAGVAIVLNEEAAELPPGETVTVAGAAFAVYRPGRTTGAAVWKEGELVVLYGDWRPQGSGLIRARIPTGTDRQVWSVKITITGAQARAEQFLEKLDLKAVLSLMQ